MTPPSPPPMLHYGIYLKDGMRLGIVTSMRIRFEEGLPKWLNVYEFHPNVNLYYWDTALREIWIRSNSIAYIKFIEYIKPPLGEVKE